MEEKETQTRKRHNRANTIILDVVVTSKNIFSTEILKKVAHCVRTMDKVKIGMTKKNEPNFAILVNDLKLFGIKIKVIDEYDYMVGMYDSICKVVVCE